MTETVADALTHIYDPLCAPKRKVEFQPRSDGRYCRIESEWTGCRWRESGREIVRDVRRE